MNKIFKTKYDITTGQTKVVSELAKNCQVASRSENKPKCGGISGNFLGLFKLLPLAFLLTGSFVYGQDINIVLSGLTANESKIGPDTILDDSSGTGRSTTPSINKVGDRSILLAPGSKSLINKKTRNWGSAGGAIAIDTKNWMAIKESVVIGHRARASANKSVAVGEQAFAALNSTSLGSEAIAYGNETVALGMQSYAEQIDDVALGHRAYAKGSQSTALGAHSSVESQKAVAIGYNARVDSQHSDAIALGAESEADSPSGNGTFMITKDDKTEAKEKTWISEKFANQFKDKLGGALSIGKKNTKYRQIVNVAPGTEDTHAVNLGQLREAMKNAGGGGVSYFSVNKLTAMQNKDNMGAKADHSLAIGVAKTEMSKGMYSIVIGTADDTASSGSSSANAQEVTKASGKAAVVIGSVAKVEADYGIALGKKATVATTAIGAIAIGKDANVQANATGAVAIGEGATVSSDAGDSIALGKNSKAEKKEEALTGLDANVGSASIKFNWTNAGTGKDKTVLSIGDIGFERIIKNVAAGKVDTNSTDAINGGQLHEVIKVFGNLGTDILGAEVNSSTKQFTNSSFAKLKDENGQENGRSATTFKQAIDESIKTINKGLKFKGDGSSSEQQLYLGSTLTIKGATGDASSLATSSSAGQNSAGTHQNIFTKTSKDTLEIALNKDLKGISTISGQQGTGGNGSAVAKIEFNSTASGGNGSMPNVKITAGTGTFTFGKDGLDLGNKQITKLGSGLNLNGAGSGAGGNGKEEIIKKILEGNPDGTTSGSGSSNISNNAVNVKDLSDIAKALVEKGLKFAVEDGSTTQPSTQNGNNPFIRKLGETLTFKGDSYLTLATENGSGGSNGGKITFKLNVANSIDTNGQGMSDTTDGNKLVTVSAVKNYLKTQLDSLTLKIEADNSNTAQAQPQPQPPQPTGTPSTSGKAQAEVKLRSQALQVLGTKDEIETKVEQGKQNVTLKLAKKVTDKLGIIQLSTENNDDSFALGKNSKWETARNVFKTTDINVGKNSLIFTWNSGISKNGKFNSVVSMGDTGAERIITHVAAGSVMPGSTDAINGGQLAEVIRVFGNLGTDILGAEVNKQTKTFKKTTFTKLKDETGQDSTVKAQETFKDAIEESIKTINKGLIFEVDDGSTTTSTDQAGSTTANKMTRQLGATIKLKGDDYIKPSIDANTGTISFKIEATEEIKENGSADGSDGNSSAEDKKLTTAGAVKKFVKNKIQTIADKQAEADKVAVKYDSEAKNTITLGGKDTNGSTSHPPVAINNLKSGLGLDNNTQGQPMGQDKTLELTLELVKKLVAGGMSGQQGQQMTKDELHKAANLADLKAVAQAGLSFAGNERGKNKTVHRKLSDTLIIKGEEETQNGQSTSSFSSAAGNIKVETNSDKSGLEIKLSDTLKNMKAFKTKEESGKKSTLNSDSLTVTDKTGTGTATATYGAKGLTVKGVGGEIKIDGEKGIITVPDIKPTTTGSAVVNKNYVDGKNNELRTQLNNTDRNLRAGIAGANAAAGLTSVSMPGKSMLAISAAGYGGENAMAIGYSRMSDNGKIMLKFQGNRNSQGKMAGSVSIGYQW
ncbi:YadA-like family protein [Histophilus somni]|uniref:YadA-like family protein n=1 Tax=Histophilus somni TaxID=731 RepID=UPI00094B63B5|nr:YadA-like family protein [Histophilus somni]